MVGFVLILFCTACLSAVIIGVALAQAIVSIIVASPTSWWILEFVSPTVIGVVLATALTTAFIGVAFVFLVLVAKDT